MNIGDDVRTAIKERFDSPVVGPFAAAWCAINWKVLVILLSLHDAPTKLDLMKTQVFDQECAWLRLALYPALAALTFLFAHPLAVRGASWWRRLQEHKSLNDRWLVNKHEFLTIEREQELLAEIEKLNDRLAAERERHSAQNVGLVNDAEVLGAGLQQAFEKWAPPPVPDMGSRQGLIGMFGRVERLSALDVERAGRMNRTDAASALRHLLDIGVVRLEPGSNEANPEFRMQGPVGAALVKRFGAT